jgi:hypothetical protein
MDIEQFSLILIFGVIPAFVILSMIKKTKDPRKKRDDLLDDDFED